MKLKLPLESEEQTALFDWAKLQKCKYPELDMLSAVPNGGSRHPVEAMNLKKQGVKAGYPDITLDVAKQGFHSLLIEMKRKPNKPTQEQLEWHEKLKYYGNRVEVCYGFEEAKNVILNYLKG